MVCCAAHPLRCWSWLRAPGCAGPGCTPLAVLAQALRLVQRPALRQALRQAPASAASMSGAAAGAASGAVAGVAAGAAAGGAAGAAVGAAAGACRRCWAPGGAGQALPTRLCCHCGVAA